MTFAVSPTLVLAEEGGTEGSFTTLASDNDDSDNDGDNSNDSDHNPVVSGENSFTTLGDSGSNPDKPLVVSNEVSFNTTGVNLGPEIVSGELSFTTLADGGGGGNNDDNNGGGGGGGGRRRNRGGSVEEPTIPTSTSCGVYITDFIKLGAANDVEQVIRLQLFLSVIEGYEVPITGFYDQVTYEAVKLFQQRYAGAILAPWGIGEPTGYVYITTTLAINNRFCSKSLNHNIDLRQFSRRRSVPAAVTGGPAGEKGFEVTPFATSTTFESATGTGTSTKPIIDQVATTAAGSVSWLKSYLCPLLIGLLLIIIGWLWWRLEEAKKRLRELDPPSLPLPPPSNTQNGS